jgi:hypothetical protein
VNTEPLPALPGSPSTLAGSNPVLFEPELPVGRSQTSSGARLWKVLLAPVKLFWAMAFCQSFLGSLVVIGWTCRLTQRSVLKAWWKQSSQRPPGESFSQHLASIPSVQHLQHWPNWFCRQNFRAAARRGPGTSWVALGWSLVKATVSSLGQNLRLGWQSILNTWVVTLPAGLLWWFGWYDGWNNSFNKGYEQAVAGPVISLLGIGWFIAAMFYVPLAQARQAVTGEWRSFYQFSLLLKVARARWLACVGLALLYVLCALPLGVLKITPMFSPQNHPHLAGLNDAEVLQHLNRYFFWSALLLLPGYVGLRLVAGRIYAAGLLRLLQQKRLSPDHLADFEKQSLDRLDLLQTPPQRERHFLVRLAAWSVTRVGRIFSGFALVLLWFAFVAQIYVTEFFNYHGALGWLNQPLVQLPWFHYLPTRLKNPFGEAFAGVLILGLFFLFRRLFRRRTKGVD